MINPSIPKFDYRSPIYRVPEDLEHHLRKYLSLIEDDGDRYVFMAIVTNASTYGIKEEYDGQVTDLLDTEQLNAIIRSERKDSKIGLGRTASNKRLNGFMKLGLFIRKKLDVASMPGGEGLRGARHQYILQPIESVLAQDLSVEEGPQYMESHKRDSEYHQGLARSRQQLIDGGAQLLEAPKDFRQAHSERLLNNVFFSCGRQSYKDPRRTRIETIYPFRKERITITATAGGDAQLFTLEDQSTVLAIITLVILHNEERMQNGKSIKNEYYVDIAMLCTLCGLKPVGANRKTLRDSIDRLYHSNLNVQCPPDSEFAQFFGLSSFTENGEQFNPDNMDLRFLSQKDSVSAVEGEYANKRAPRYYRISLHPIIFKQLSDPEVWNTFVVNPRLLKDRLKMVTHLYFFAARTIARDPKIVRRWNIRTIQRLIMPSYDRYHNWERSLFNDLATYAERTGQVWSKEEECTIDLYGYFVKFEPNPSHGHILTFWFNQNDPLLGKSANRKYMSGNPQIDLLQSAIDTD